MLISDELALFLGKKTGTSMTRPNVFKKLLNYVEANCRSEKTIIIPDEKLRNLLKLREGDTLTYFNMGKYTKPHFME